MHCVNHNPGSRYEGGGVILIGANVSLCRDVERLMINQHVISAMGITDSQHPFLAARARLNHFYMSSRCFVI